MKNWKTVKEGQVRTIWACTDEECECDHKEIDVSPSWNWQNGTPICSEGRDMEYLRTEVEDFGHNNVSKDFATLETE